MRTAYISFASEISEHSVQALISSITDQINRRVQHLYIIYTSPGGSTTSGYYLYNFLRALPVRLTMHACGMVASMGPAIYLAGERRLSVPNSIYMFHSCGSASYGNWADERYLAENLKYKSSLNRMYVDILLERTKLQKNEALSLATGGMQNFTTDWLLKKDVIHEVAEPVIPPGATIIQPNF